MTKDQRSTHDRRMTGTTPPNAPIPGFKVDHRDVDALRFALEVLARRLDRLEKSIGLAEGHIDVR